MTLSEDVSIGNIHIGGDGHPDKWYLAVWGKSPSTRVSMEKLKQQILENQQKLKEIEELFLILGYVSGEITYRKVKAILERKNV